MFNLMCTNKSSDSLYIERCIKKKIHTRWIIHGGSGLVEIIESNHRLVLNKMLHHAQQLVPVRTDYDTSWPPTSGRSLYFCWPFFFEAKSKVLRSRQIGQRCGRRLEILGNRFQRGTVQLARLKLIGSETMSKSKPNFSGFKDTMLSLLIGKKTLENGPWLQRLPWVMTLACGITSVINDINEVLQVNCDLDLKWSKKDEFQSIWGRPPGQGHRASRWGGRIVDLIQGPDRCGFFRGFHLVTSQTIECINKYR